MFRIILVLSAVALPCGSIPVFGPTAGETKQQESDGIAELQKQRIDLLRQRVEVARRWIAEGRAGTADLIRPQLDLLNAQLEYEESDDGKKKLLREIIDNYDKLIELAEFQLHMPPRSSSDGVPRPLSAESHLLFLKSERLRIQIQLKAME